MLQMLVSLEPFLGYEQTAIDKCLKHHHGYELMWMGVGDESKASASPIGHHFNVACDRSLAAGMVCDSFQMPFAKETIDMIVMHHVVDGLKSFDAIIAEANRVLRHDGMLLVTAFNPLRQRAHTLYPKVVGQKTKKHFRSLTQLRKIIEPLGFSLYRHYYYGFADSPKMEAFYARCVPGLGVGYTVLFQKRVCRLTPLKSGRTAAEKIEEVTSAIKPTVPSPVTNGPSLRGIYE